MPGQVNLVHERTGERVSFPDDPVSIALAAEKGYRREATGDQIGAAVEAERERRTSGVIPGVMSGITSFASGATLGGSDAVIRAVGGQDAATNLREIRDAHRGPAIVGDIAGTIASGGTNLPGGLAAKAGARVAQTAEGASTLARIGRATAGGVVEGGLQGLGQGVSEVSLSDKVTLEHIASSLSSNMLFGGATGGLAGGAAKGLEVGLGRAKRAIDDFRTRGDVADGLPDDLATMDLKQLRGVRDVELDNIKTARAAEKEVLEQGRVVERQAIADELGAHHTAIDSEKAWLATKDSTEGEIRTIGKQLFNANRPLRNMLDNPKYLAERPQQALSALQKQEHAFEQMLRVDGRLRRTFEEGAVAGELTQKEINSLNHYKGGGYLDIQDYARTGKRSRGSGLRTAKEAKEELARLDSAIAKSEIGEDMVVYRGVSDELGVRRPGISGDIEVGGVLRDKGYSSTSLARDKAVDHAFKVGGKPVLLEIEIPKGSRGTINEVLDGGEMLLGRNSGFEIRSIRTEIVNDVEVRIARARYVAPGPATTKAGVGARTAPGARAAALDTVPAALERNRALQARIRESTSDLKLTTPDVSPRLQQIEEARDLLSSGKGEKTIAEQMLQSAVFSGVAGGVTGLASDSPLAGVAAMAAPLIGARASRLVAEGFGRAGRVSNEVAKRASRAVDTLLSASKEVSRLAPPLATKVLAAVRYAPEEKATPKKADLATLYHARSSELRSQTMYAQDGSIQMRPEARAQVAARLAPIAAVDPRAADMLETIAARRVEFLSSKLPRRPDIGGLPLSAGDRWRPSDLDMRQFARYAAAVEDPTGIVERVADGTVTPSDTEVMKAVYPEMYSDITQQIVSRLPELRAALPYRQRLALSRFTGEPVDASMHPRILAVLQAAHAQEPGTAGGTMPAKPKPNFGSTGSISKRSESGQTPSQRRSA